MGSSVPPAANSRQELDVVSIAEAIRSTLSRESQTPWLPDPRRTRVRLLADGVYHANFTIESGEQRTVARVVRASQWGLTALQQLTREHAVLWDLRAEDVAPAPIRLMRTGPFPFMIQSYVPGRYARHETDLAACAKAIAAAHRCPPERSASLVDGRKPKEFLIRDSRNRIDGCPRTPSNEHTLSLLERAWRLLASADLPDFEPVLTHTDLIQRNLLVDGDVCRIVDWEGARVGCRAWDVAYFLSPVTLGWADPPAELREGQREAFLDAYGSESQVPVGVLAFEVAAILPFVLLRALSWCVAYAAHRIEVPDAAVRDRLTLFTSAEFIALTFDGAGVSL